MKKAVILLVINIFYLISFGQKQFVAPRIISTIPEFGDYHVNPNIKEIIIRFDQDMLQKMSIISTKNFPIIDGNPKWIDSKTFSIPVKLYPNKLYSIGFNSLKYQNFKNVSGIPLNPDILTFHTQVIPFKKQNRKAYSELIDIFPKKYSYASLNGLDWKTLLENNQNEFKSSETSLEFALQLLKLLKLANDPHIWVEIEDQKFETNLLRIVDQNYNYEKVFPILNNVVVSNNRNQDVLIGMIGSVGYILIKTWKDDFFEQTYRELDNPKNSEISAFEVISKLFEYPNIIIDVRDNLGGNESFAKKFTSYFIKDTLPYEIVKYFNDKSEIYNKEIVKKAYPNGKNYYSGKVYVLSGPKVMSSNESFILMMKQASNCQVVGMDSYGCSGNPKRYELSNGITLFLPSWQAYTLEGSPIEGKGIRPDIEIVTKSSDFNSHDILIEKVLELINETQ